MALTNIGFAGTVNEVDYSRLTDAVGLGSVTTESSWRVTPVTGNRQVNIAPGTGTKAGIRSTSTENTIVTLAPPVGTTAMWYLIVARRTWGDERTTEFVAVPGEGIAEIPARLPPRYFPVAMADNPGVVDDQPIAWAFVNQSNTVVQVFDLRMMPPGTYPGFTDYNTGADNGYAQNPGQDITHTNRAYTLGLRRWVSVTGSIHLDVGNDTPNAAGNLIIMQGDTIMRSRRWHSRARAGRLDPMVKAAFSIEPGNSSVALRLSVDGGSGAAGVAVYEAELVVEFAPA